MKKITRMDRRQRVKGNWKDYDHCYEEAKKYKNRREFHDKNRKAYYICKENGWLDKFGWLPNLKADGAKVESVY